MSGSKVKIEMNILNDYSAWEIYALFISELTIYGLPIFHLIAGIRVGGFDRVVRIGGAEKKHCDWPWPALCKSSTKKKSKSNKASNSIVEKPTVNLIMFLFVYV